MHRGLLTEEDAAEHRRLSENDESIKRNVSYKPKKNATTLRRR